MALTQTDINWLKESLLPDFARTVRDELASKLDEISNKLDKFIGDIQDKRSEQTLHEKDHDRIDKRLHRVESKVGLPPYAD